MESGFVRQYLYKYQKIYFFLLDKKVASNSMVMKILETFSVYIKMNGHTGKTNERYTKRYDEGMIRRVEKYKV